MKTISFRVLSAILALVLVHFLLFSSLCLNYEHRFSRDTSLSRKLLSSSSDSDSASTSVGKISGSKKQHNKDLDQSLRKAPSTGPNPTQNKYPTKNK
ncbi:hypothetical protein Lal_00036428 [Lupinus albus]|uniref:Uncharacterized protein n=1 Tax=Lupinus albus TaxID=3870 RepID=A0A6A4P4E4_LUPAL|nr:hypothetical protein Lalb_Chr18g0047811 [Lupinus albus]KAF1892073.1 hypothetical protein Lal_00036428 [Lupinus albus]